MAIERDRVLLGYQVQRQKYTINAEGKKVKEGGQQAVRGNAIILLPKNVVTYFDIPVYNPTDTANLLKMAVSEYKGHTRIVYGDLDDATGVSVNIEKGFRISGGKRDKVYGNSVRVPTGKKTPKGNDRYMSFAFPSFFNLIMITQALGTMIKTTTATKKPNFFLSQAGGKYPIDYGTETQPLTINGKQLTCGAWLLSAPITPQNADDPGDNIPGGTVEAASKGGKKKASA